MQTYHTYLFDYVRHTQGRQPSIEAKDINDLRRILIREYLKPRGITDLAIDVEIIKTMGGMRYVDVIGTLEIQSALDSVKWKTYGKDHWTDVSKRTGRLM